MRTPLPHQQEAIDRLVSMGGRGLLCDEMGLGKSSVALWVMGKHRACPIVVICPLSVTHKWVDEIETTLAPDVLGGSILLLKDRRHLAKAKLNEPGAIVLHYELAEAFAQECGEHTWWLLEDGAGLIVDECHYAKNRTAARSRAVRTIASHCSRGVLCLTGTLVRNDVRDVWHPTELAVPGHLGTYAMFEAKYCDFRQFKLPSMRRPVKQFTSSKNEAQLAAKLNEVMVRRKKIDVVDLPPKQRVVVPLDLDKESARAYREMKQRAMVELESEPRLVTRAWCDAAPEGPGKIPVVPGQAIIARTALEQAIRLEQITNGVIGGADEPIVLAAAAKLEWAVETITDLWAEQRSVAVFGKFNLTLHALVGKLASYTGQVRMLCGDTPSEDRPQVISKFREEGGCLLVQLRLAEGFDLTPCTDAIFLGIDWTPAMMDQAEDRLHRIGTTGQVTCYYPLMRKTIDERLYRVVMEKREDARRVLGDVQVMREEVAV